MTYPGHSKAARAAVLQVIERAPEPLTASEIVVRAGYGDAVVRSALRALLAEGFEREIRIADWVRMRGKPAARYDFNGDMPDAPQLPKMTPREIVLRHEARRKLNPEAYAARKERDRCGSERSRARVLAYLTDKATEPMSARELSKVLYMSMSATQKAVWGLHELGVIRRATWVIRSPGRPTPKFDMRTDQPDAPSPGARSRAERKAEAMKVPESAARIREQNARYARNRTAQRLPSDQPPRAAPAAFDWKPSISWNLNE